MPSSVFKNKELWQRPDYTIHIYLHESKISIVFFFFFIKEKYCESVCKICDNLHRFKIDENDVAKTSKQKKKRSKKKKKKRSNTSI